jgi:hypothetical protein
MFDVKRSYVSVIHVLRVSYNFDICVDLNPSTYFAFQNGLEVLILLYLFSFLFLVGK